MFRLLFQSGALPILRGKITAVPEKQWFRGARKKSARYSAASAHFVQVIFFYAFLCSRGKSLNLGLIPEYARFLKSNNIHGVLVNGTTGEGTSQTVEEREKVAEAWIRASKETDQCVVVQVGGTNLKCVQRLASHAEEHGASAILCLADLFHRPKTADELIRYLSLVSRHAPNTPLLYYHLPDFTGINVNMKELLLKAYTIKTFAGIKYTSNDIETGSRCLPINEGKYAIFLGSDKMLLPAFAMGFDSAIGTTLNMMPRENFDIYHLFQAGHLEQALKTQKKLTQAIDHITEYGNWVESMKTAMNLLTPINVGQVRDPLSPVPENKSFELSQKLKAMQISQLNLFI